MNTHRRSEANIPKLAIFFCESAEKGKVVKNDAEVMKWLATFIQLQKYQ
jgi:hypothetical protein